MDRMQHNNISKYTIWKQYKGKEFGILETAKFSSLFLFLKQKYEVDKNSGLLTRKLKSKWQKACKDNKIY